LFAKEVVGKTELAGRDFDSARDVDGLVERELDSFNQVKGDCVLEPTGGLMC
jgi:hypothetical protein